MKATIQPVRGTYDYPPIQAESREIIKQKILESYQDNGFSLITTPILENLSLLSGSDGGDNLKLMFKTVKRGDKLDLTKPNLTEQDICEEGLRYDLTVPLARFYAGNRENLPNPFKSIQIGYSFRAERPQKGRDRQFIQCDVDIFGDESVNAEIELLLTGIDTYAKLGINNVVMKVNDRKILTSLILNCGFNAEDVNSVCISLDKLDKIGTDAVKQEIIDNGFDQDKASKLMYAVEDIKVKGISALNKYNIDTKYIEDINCLINTVNSVADNGKCEFDLTIVRGQGYYTGIVYEAYADGFLGAVGGGGRYDKMINKIIGIDVPAVGFSIGFERVNLILNGKIEKAKKKIALIYDKQEDYIQVLQRKKQLMQNYAVSTYARAKNMKALLDKLQFANFDGFVSMQDTNIKMF